MYTSDAYTLTGDLTVNDTIGLMSATGNGTNVTVMNDGSNRTITGSGTVEGGELYSSTNNLSGMIGELGTGVTLGDAVTGTPAISGNFPLITGLGTVTSGNLGSGVTGLGWQPVGSLQTTFSSTEWFITGFTDEFRIWMVQIDSMRPASDGKECKIYFLKDASSIATGTHEYASVCRDSGGTNDNQSNTSYPYVTAMMGNSVERMSNGSIIVYNARNHTSVVNATMQFNIVKNDGQIGTEVGSLTMNGADSEKIVGVRLLPWNGDWASVSAQVYGMN